MIRTSESAGRTKSTQITHTMCLSMIKKWQKVLYLEHWTLGVSTTLPAENHDMEIVITPIRQHGAIRVNPKCWNYSKGKFEQLIVHELLHTLFHPLEREYLKGLRSTGKFPSDDCRFYDSLETTVDHLSKVLYNLHTN